MNERIGFPHFLQRVNEPSQRHKSMHLKKEEEAAADRWLTVPVGEAALVGAAFVAAIILPTPAPRCCLVVAYFISPILLKRCAAHLAVSFFIFCSTAFIPPLRTHLKSHFFLFLYSLNLDIT